MSPEASRAILLVDDEEQILRSYEMTLRMGGYPAVIACQKSRKALAMLAENPIGLVLLDLTMPEMSGEELLDQIKQIHPNLPVVIITGNDAVPTAVQCIKAGAEDYLVKPICRDRLLTTVRRVFRALDKEADQQRMEQALRFGKLADPSAFSEIVTNNPDMLGVFRYVEAISRSSECLLITGETGVGKELLARAAHKASGRSGPFLPVNLAGLSESMIDDTLFGHVKGAFTGADRPRRGLVEEAAGGTLFLDEIGDMPPGLQVKLLRLLQEGEFFPLGKDRPMRADVRIIAATHKDLNALCQTDVFRKDLYYRVATHHVTLPPLRRRRGDIPLLISHFTEEAAEQFGRTLPDTDAQTLASLMSYNYPGNVRELRSLVFDAVGAFGSLEAAIEPLVRRESGDGSLSEDPPPSAASSGTDLGLSFGASLPTIEQAKDLLIEEALLRTGGNKTLTAKLLGISRQALNKRQRRGETDERR